ncbi:MAG: radical SAM protein, partial [Draconibacterium sp.]|nr:radical SAM protein [Draconibacterium sp.]
MNKSVSEMHEAQFYTKLKNNKVLCELCPWDCKLETGQTGVCKVRTNENGKLVTLVY